MNLIIHNPAIFLIIFLLGVCAGVWLQEWLHRREDKK
jgi:hypothetical protein